MPKPYRRADARGRDERLRTTLQAMLDRGERISARGVLKHLPDLRAPSSLTRDPLRRSVLEEFRKRQADQNAWVDRAKKQTSARLQKLLADRDSRIAQLERDVQFLVASHRAMVHAVGELGGVPVWKKAFDGYERSLQDIINQGALPQPKAARNRGPRSRNRTS